jgi:hypothetical protein
MVKGVRDRSVRGSIASAPWEENAHARDSQRRSQDREHEYQRCMTIRRSDLGWREPSGSLVSPRGAQDSAGCPRHESGVREPGTLEVQVHVVRLGGRYRSDTSRVFSTGRSQGLLVNERALAGRKSVAPFDAAHGWVDGETVRVRGFP